MLELEICSAPCEFWLTVIVYWIDFLLQITMKFQGRKASSGRGPQGGSQVGPQRGPPKKTSGGFKKKTSGGFKKGPKKGGFKINLMLLNSEP